MKNEKIKTNKTKIIARVMLVVAIVSFITTVGCNFVNPNGLERGIKITNEANELCILCQSDKNEFDINNVTLTFYFGMLIPSGVEFTLEHGRNYPIFEIWFINDERDQILIKRVEENLISEKYKCEWIFDDDYNVVETRYNHYETLTIPTELFTKDLGMICFSIFSANVAENEEELRTISEICIYYKKIDNKVILSKESFN